MFIYCVHICLAVLCIFVAFVFRTNGFLLALQINKTFFSELLCFRVVFYDKFSRDPEVFPETGIALAWLGMKRELKATKLEQLIDFLLFVTPVIVFSYYAHTLFLK